jgi:hypothetical protein
MKTKYPKAYFLIAIISLSFLNSCSKDESLDSDPFVVAFESLSKNLTTIESEENIEMVYSEIANENGSITVQIIPQNAVYGIDFATMPEAIANNITLPIISGDIQNSIVFQKL